MAQDNSGELVDTDALLAEQVAYYRTRAPEYDNWWHRTRQYALPAEEKAIWDREVADMERWVDDLDLTGDVLELACGTGIWTRRLVESATHVTGVDAAPEVLALNRERLQGEAVEYVQADVFEWKPDRTYDAVFFSFWLSHVPPSKFADFWSRVGDALAPGGRAVFIDNRWREGAWPPERPTDFVQVRSDLTGGPDFRIVKLYYEPDELAQLLRAEGWNANVDATDRFFIRGVARPQV